MRDFVKWEKQAHYPHMRDFEISLIERFIEKYPNEYDKVAYSFPVGAGAPADPIVNQETGGSAEYLYFQKIDMVCKKGSTIDIIEVKKKAGASAVGQVVGYRDLFVLEQKPNTIPKCIVLTDQTNPDLEYIAKMQKVQIVVV